MSERDEIPIEIMEDVVMASYDCDDLPEVFFKVWSWPGDAPGHDYFRALGVRYAEVTGGET